MPNVTTTGKSSTNIDVNYLNQVTGFMPMDYPKDKTLIDLLEEQVKKTPNNTALIFNNIEITYDELNAISNQFGNYLLKTYGVKPDDLIGMILERSEWMIIAILGILKAGGAYVPVDPEYPQERINYLLNDSACKLLINEAELDKFKKVKDQYSKENPVTGLKANNLVYCIYTSGSTGNPKGVLVEHRNVINLLWGQKAVYNITPDERVLQFSTITFDPSAEQIWIALITGAALVVVNKHTLMDIKVFERYIIDKKVSHIHTVPAYLAELSIQDMTHVKRVITGGESCSPLLAEKWKNQCMFINEYGPTETTITSLEYVAIAADNYHTFIPIGRPVANTPVYVLDNEQQLLPHGELGEIYIGGDGVTRGYLNRPELTAERFIPDPFKQGERMYRTGDVGRWLPDGNMEYLGRIDDQVKIKGYRIELDEISTVIQKYPKVNAAVVVARTINSTDKELVAYTTGGAQTAELINYLKEQLPVYMVPSYFVQLDSLPLTPNGKVDRKVLPMPEKRNSQQQGSFAAPVSDMEKALASIWQHILNIEQVGIDDNFFDLGGSSLMVIRTINQINKEICPDLTVASLYQMPTIRQLAHKIDTGTYKDVSPVIVLKKGEGTPLFIFPPWSSYPTIFNEFVKSYTGKNPLYGIIYTDDSEDFPFKNVQEYVQHVIKYIKVLYPTGPYGLLGYSMGARTILEVGIQLQKAGDQVDFLGIISHYPGFPPKRFFLSRRTMDELRVFRQISIPLKLKYMKHRFPYFLKLLITGNNDIQKIVLEVNTQQKMLDIHEEYYTNYKFTGNPVLIYETRPDGDASEFKKVQVYRNSIFKKLWKPYINGTIIMRNVECRHIDFFKQPNVKEIVNIIEPYLR